MRAPRLSLDELERINAASAYQADRVQTILARAAYIAGDGDKERRLAARHCLGCHHSHGLAGQAFTSWKCRFCGTEAMHSNTATPRLCVTCADTFGLCVECGGDISMRHRTRRFGRAGKKQKVGK